MRTLRTLLLAVFCLSVASLHAAIISWDPPQPISGFNDVSTNGSYFGSWAPYNPLAQNSPVNGVTFFGDDLGITYTGFNSGTQIFGTHTTPDSNYNGLLQNGIFSDGTNASFTLNGDGMRPLVAGRPYLIQCWVSDTQSFGAGRTERIGSSAPLTYQSTNGMGQFLVGRFIADGPSQTFSLNANASAQLNFLQVRDLSTNTPPALSVAASRSILSLGDSSFIRVTVNPGSNPTITNVTLDASSIGVTTPVRLIAAGGNVYTNSIVAAPGSVYGNQTLIATATDADGYQGEAIVRVFLPTPSPYRARANALETWRSNRFGMFIHWGPVSLTGQEISWSRANSNPLCPNDGSIAVDVYDDLYRQFNPTNFNASNWVAIAKGAGMKYVVFTAKHHDGFLLWDSKASSYNIMNTPFGRDICRELSDAVHAAGLKLGWYFSGPDWKDGRFRNAHNAEYIKTMQSELRELLSNYGKVDLLWFDFDSRTNSYDVTNTYAMCRSLQPEIVFNNRLDLASQTDYAAQPPVGAWADYYTPEQRVGGFDNQNPWESCMTIGTQWSWMPDDNIKSFAQSLSILLQCAGGDGNLLYDLGPQANGAFEPRYVDVISGMGAWLRQNGESVYGTRGGPWLPTANFASTRQGNNIYLHLMPPQRIVTLSALPAQILVASVLTGGEILFTQTVNSVTLQLSPEAITNSIATVKLTLASAASTIPPRPAFESSKMNWQTAQPITGSSDVNTEGSLVLACQASASDRGGYPDQTVNGVHFSGNANSTNSVAYSIVGDSGYEATLFLSAKTFAGQDGAAYGRMLAGAWYTAESGPIALQFSGLATGHTYLVQVWAADYREFPNVRTESFSAATGADASTPMLKYLSGDGTTPGSGSGQSAIGRFTASAPNISFLLSGNESSQLNAFQLRDITVPPARISASMAGTNVVLSWPAAYIGWTLQARTNTQSFTNWKDLPGTELTNSQMITVSPSNPPAFYRLREK